MSTGLERVDVMNSLAYVKLRIRIASTEGEVLRWADRCVKAETERDRLRFLLHLAYEAAFHDGGMTPNERDEMRRALTPQEDPE